MPYGDVVLPVPTEQIFTYALDPSLNPTLNTRVLVPFGNRKEVGILLKTHSEKLPFKKIKTLETVLDPEPLCSPIYREWLDWASQYYQTPLGEVWGTALPGPLFQPKSLEALEGKKVRKSALTDHWTHEKKIHLNPAQKEVLTNLLEITASDKFSPALLHGITGSGKTEIYIPFIEALLKKGQQVIFLVPEIGLTPQIIGRFRSHFGEGMGLYHSGLTENQRLQEWLRARKGQSQLMVGTRSALFAPFPRLGAIILDEEHDSSYKQEERFRYHARDLALVRGKMEKCAVLLGSATPSLESYLNAKEGKYRLFNLKERAGGARPPEMILVDMAAQKRQTQSPLALCQELFTGIERNLEKGEQTILFLNRRGFARSFFCLACEKAVVCPNCSVSLIYHKRNRHLLCHYCDFTILLPDTCPECKGHEVTLLGSGTETLEEEIKTYFPKARIARLDRDSTQKKGALLDVLKNLKDGKIDILVGTQMIAKGHDFPSVTLVGILGIDSGLGMPDFRASERTFQLLMQVAGRAGRGELPGKVIVQSYTPQHDSVQFGCRQDYEGFFEAEMGRRQELGYPPQGRLIQFQFSAISETRIIDFIQKLDRLIEGAQRKGPLQAIQILGPSPAPLEKIRGRHRWHLLLKGKTVSQTQHAALKLRQLLTEMKPSGIKWVVDVDPVAML